MAGRGIAVGRLIGVSGTMIRDTLTAHSIRAARQAARVPSVDAELADTEWLRARYSKLGLMGVAAELRTTPERWVAHLTLPVSNDSGRLRPSPLGSAGSYAVREAERRAVVERVVTALGGDPDDYDWPDTGG